MDDNYPTLKRSKKQLTYPTSKPSLLRKWTKEKMTLEDVDNMFDDLVCPEVEEILSPSPVVHIPVKKRSAEGMASPVLLKVHSSQKRLKCQMAANNDQCEIPKSPELVIAHGPIKTSSPIDEKVTQSERREKEDCSTTPILFDVEEESQDAEPVEKLSKHRKDESDDSVFATLPSKSVITKMSAQIRPKTAPASSNLRCEATSGSSEKLSENAQIPTRTKPTITSFLQKLRDAGQSKPARIEMSQAKVTPFPSEAELEDDFVIMDDVPLYISIPSKSAKNKEKQPKSSDKETKNSSGDGPSVDKQQGSEQENKPVRQNVNEKLKKNTRDKVSKSHSSGSDTGKDAHLLPTPEPTNTEKRLDQGKAKKNKSQKKKFPSKEEDKDPGKETNDGDPVKTADRKGSKSLKNNKVNVKKERTLTLKERRKIEKVIETVKNTVEQQRQESSGENLTNNEALGIVSEPRKYPTDMNLKQSIPSSSIEGTSDEEGRIVGKRIRKPPGEWWMCCESTEQWPTIKKPKPSKQDPGGAAPPVKTTTSAKKKTLKPSSSSSSPGDRQRIKTKPVFAEPIEDCALDQDSDSRPLVFLHRERNLSGWKVFHNVYQNSSDERLSFTPEHASSRTAEEQLSSEDSLKRRRKPPRNWWQVNSTPEDKVVASSQPQQPKPQKRKIAGVRKKLSKVTQSAVPSRSKPLEGAPKQKRSLSTFQDLCCTVTVSPTIRKDIQTTLTKQHYATSTSAAEVLVTEQNGVSLKTEGSRAVQNNSNTIEAVSENTLNTFRSGPCSVIQLENFEEDNEDIAMPSTTVQSILGVSDLCSPPLRPLKLQPQDKKNLKEWLNILWPTKDKRTEITPDNFEWYVFQGRAIGFMVDIRSGSICSGKMLLGSFMKKPLWVDHCATTVFHLLTSSVNVIVDCMKSQYSAGQSFMVKSGHAHSVHNSSAKPAILYFTRIYSEEDSDN